MSTYCIKIGTNPIDLVLCVGNVPQTMTSFYLNMRIISQKVTGTVRLSITFPNPARMNCDRAYVRASKFRT